MEYVFFLLFISCRSVYLASKSIACAREEEEDEENKINFLKRNATEQKVLKHSKNETDSK